MRTKTLQIPEQQKPTSVQWSDWLYIRVNRKEFLKLPMTIRRREVARMADTLVAQEALDALVWCTI